MSGGGFFNNFNPFGGRAGNSERQGQDERGTTNQGTSRWPSFPDEVDEQEYDFAGEGVPRGHGQRIPADNSYEGMGSQRGGYAQRTTTNNNNYDAEDDYEEYESRRQAMFQLGGNPQPDSMGNRPTTRPDVWPNQQGIGQPWGDGMGHGQGPPRQRNQDVPENLGAPAGTNNAGAVPQGPPAHQGAAGNQPGGQAGITNAPPIGGTKATPPKEWSGIASALARLQHTMTDASTSRNLRWQKETKGETAKLAIFKVEATSLPNLQFFAFMQPGEAFIVLGHSMATIYSTATDIATFHGNIVLFIGDRKQTRDCIAVVVPPKSAFEWTKCKVLDDPEALQEWYADDRSQYGKLRDPQQGDAETVELHVPRMIALPLRAAQLYQTFNGPVMPHELLAAIEQHLASPDTDLDNGDDWGLVKKWLVVAAQTDGGQGTAKPKSHIAFTTNAIITNDELIHQWFADRLDATMGKRPEATSHGMTGGMQDMKNMSGIIAAEVGRGVGRAMQSVARSSPTQASNAGSSDDAKPYTPDHIATLLGFHGVSDARWIKDFWKLAKVTKVVNYDYLRRMIKKNMLMWAEQNRCVIDEHVYFDNKTIDEWIALKFNPGDSTALYSSADKGISILICRAPTSAALEDLRRNEDIWAETKNNATFYEVTRQTGNKVVRSPPSDLTELRQNISTFCALLWCLFGEGCDLWRSIESINRILNHPFSSQNKTAYTPEVCKRIVWAIIVDTRQFFDDIKLREDFINHRGPGKFPFPVSVLQGEYMNIKFGATIHRHNFPKEWMTVTREHHGPQGGHQGGYQGGHQGGGAGRDGGGGGGRGGYQPPDPTPRVPVNWRTPGFVDERHPKIQTMMEPFLVQFGRRISVSNILTASGKRFEDLPKLDEFPGGVCWLHSLAICPYGTNCSFSAGHVPKGTLTEAHADQVVETLQVGITQLMSTAPPSGGSPSGRKRQRGGQGRGGGRPSPPPTALIPM